MNCGNTYDNITFRPNELQGEGKESQFLCPLFPPIVNSPHIILYDNLPYEIKAMPYFPKSGV